MISSLTINQKVNGKIQPYVIPDPKLKRKAINIATFNDIEAPPLKRIVIYHSGVPNSGKTYNAIKSLQQAKNGIYCAPLRLMAYEVYDQLLTLGIECNLCLLYTSPSPRD